MSRERVNRLVASFRERVRKAAAGRARALAPELSRADALDLVESMLLARHLDVAAHELRASGEGHYTICSSGHEGNVVLGHLTGTTDPALLHYRSAAFVVERARNTDGYDPVREIALSLVASRLESTSGGRHKVFGGRPIGVLPTTSTIASHLPRAVGLALAIERKHRLGVDAPRGAVTDPRSIVIVSFGDASINHSTALGAFNAAGWVVQQRLTLPLLFVCEDNGLGISVRSPPGWVERRLRTLPNVRYFASDGTDLASSWAGAEEATRFVRERRLPAVLHLSCVRLLGHAGSDVDTAYRRPEEIESAVQRDPVTNAAIALIDAGIASPDELLALDEAARERVHGATEEARRAERLQSRAEVASKVTAPVPAALAAPAKVATEQTSPTMTLAQGLNRALAEALETRPEVLLFGEDVARKGGVYGVTKGLLAAGGPARVFNTLLDEQTILGLALGAASVGFVPIPEIQYLAYVHNAEDQLRGEAATMPFFSAGTFDNPMVVRIASFAYQRGFGGHFHNDNSTAVLRDVPGLAVFVPARADDAIELYRTALELASEARRVVIALEPIALYHQRDLEDGDAEWLANAPSTRAAFGEPRVYGEGPADLTIATYGNGLRLSLRAARTLEREHGLVARVVDLRWLSPLPTRRTLELASHTGVLLVVDECRRTANVSEELAAAALEVGADLSFARVTSADCFVPLGDAARLVLVDEREIVAAAIAVTARGKAPA